MWKRARLVPLALAACALPVHSAYSAPAPSVQLPQSGAFTCYDSTGGEISCTDTHQDGALRNGASWPEPRFNDPGNGSISDSLTGLVWTKDARFPGPPDCAPGETRPWKEALTYVACLNTNSYLGFSDWRLPNINELSSLLDASRSGPSLPLGHPFLNVLTDPIDVNGVSYWSSTSHVGAPQSAFVISMYDGNMRSQMKEWTNLVAWPVRGSTGGPAQVPATGQTLCFDPVTYNAAACSDTGQDGELLSGVPWPTPRFVDNNNQTMSDSLTGLIWPKQDLGTGTSCNVPQYVSWQGALDLIECLNMNSYLTFSDWRMPNVVELATLVNRNEENSAAWLTKPQTGFASFYAIPYWTSTTDGENHGAARTVDMLSGVVDRLGKTVSGQAGLLPVRAGIIPPPPPPSIALAPASHSFGTIMAGAPVSSGFAISNTAAPGSSSLRISSISVTGGAGTCTLNTSGGYSPCGSTSPLLAPGNTCTVSISCTPTATGAFSAHLTFGTNIPGQSAMTVPLTATVVPAVQLTVSTSGTGGGTVTSTPAGISCTSGSLFGCTSNFPSGTVVTLSATTRSDSAFTGWQSACTGSGTCGVTMNTSRSVGATFVGSPAVRIYGTPHLALPSLQAAYDAALTGAVIQLREGLTEGNLTATRPVTVTLQAGFNPTFSAGGELTEMYGPLVVRNGTVRIGRLAVQ